LDPRREAEVADNRPDSVTTTPEPSAPASRFSLFFPIWALGAALRLAFVWLEPKTSPVADETMWLMALNRIPAARFSPFANYPIFHPPLYPYFLAAVNGLFGGTLAIKAAQALIGSLLIPAVWRIARKLFGSRTALAAGVFVAFYPELIWYSAHFWCETLFVALLWWAIERLVTADETSSRADAVMAGLLFGLAILTRETVLYLLPLAALWLAWSKPRTRPSLAVTLLVSAFVVVAPWTVRNWIQFQAFIPVSTGGGLNLYQGNAEISRGEVYDGYYANEGRVEQYRWARTEGIKAIWRRQPAWLFEKIRDEGPRLFELDSLALIHLRRRAYADPACGVYRSAAAIVVVPWILIAAGSLVAAARAPVNRQRVFLAGLLASYLLLHIVTHGFSRYRLPVIPAFIILAGSLADLDCRTGRTPVRRLLLLGLAVGLAFLWAPSLLDQLGHLGFVVPPDYEGFAPICPGPGPVV
jgi:4-amino-4-deoxy-L-arabinose transferase-like glycosyltransferase